ncbi:MAG TPA: Hpt domain-containing protein [Gemmatimonadales bacterium]
MNEPLEQLIARLRGEYLAETPDRLVEMRSALERWRGGLTPEGPSLLTLFHRLAGSAGAYGFGDVSALCRTIEQWLAQDPPAEEANGRRIAEAIDTIEAAFTRPPTTEGIDG